MENRRKYRYQITPLTASMKQRYGNLKTGETLVVAPPGTDRFQILPLTLPKNVGGWDTISEFMTLSEKLVKSQICGHSYLDTLAKLVPPKPKNFEEIVRAKDFKYSLRPDPLLANYFSCRHEYLRQELISELLVRLKAIDNLINSLLNMKIELLKTLEPLRPVLVRMLRKRKRRATVRVTTNDPFGLWEKYQRTGKKSIRLPDLHGFCFEGPELRIASHNVKPMPEAQAEKMLAKHVSSETFKAITFPIEDNPPWFPVPKKQEPIIGGVKIVSAIEVAQSIRDEFLNMNVRLCRMYARLTSKDAGDMDVTYKRKVKAFKIVGILGPEKALMKMRQYAAYNRSERVVNPSKWYLELFREAVDLNALTNNEVRETLDELMKVSEVDELTIPNCKEKLCLLTLSLPVTELANQSWQRAIQFLLDKLMYAPKGILQKWLKYRGLSNPLDQIFT